MGGVGSKLAAGLALAGSVLGACGQPEAAPDFTVRGVGVVVRSDAPFAHRADFPGRVESTIEAALAYWGGDWRRLEGATVYLEGAPKVRCPGAAAAVGCYDGDVRVTTLEGGLALSCVEQTALAHEVGHAVVGDALHADPRWLGFEAVALALGGRVGYGAAGEVDCTVFPGIWQHPPDAGRLP
jgi:hypothetical protein